MDLVDCGARPVVRVGLERYVDPPAVPSTQPVGTRADHGLPALGLRRVGLGLLVAHVLPDVPGTIGDREQRQDAVGPAQLQHHVRGVRCGHRRHALEVRLPVGGPGRAAEDPVVGEGDVPGRQVLAVGPLHPAADVEGPGASVVRCRPLRGQAGLRRHVLHRVRDQEVVGERPGLVGHRLEAEERVERVDLAEEADGEGRLVGRVGGCGGPGQGQAGCEAGEQQTGRRDRPCRGTLTARRPPEARREPFEHREHGVSRPDPYHWMRNTTPELLAHLAAERGFYDSACAHLHSLVSTLRAEMVSRLPPADVSPTWRRLRFSYYTRHLAGSDYGQILREIHGSETDSRPIPGSGPPRPTEIAATGPSPWCCSTSTPWRAASGHLDLGVTR